MSIKQKISLYAALLLSVALIGFWALLQYKLLQSFKSQVDSFGDILSKQVADSVTELVLANDLLGLNVVLGQLNNEPGVQSATITDVDGQVIASTLAPSAPAPSSGNLYIAPITVQDAVAGRLILVLDDNIISDPFGQSNLLFLGAWGAALLLALLLSWRLGNQIASPLLELADALDAASTEEEPVEIEISELEEVGLLQQRVADVLAVQQQLKEELSITGIPFEDDDSQLQRPERRMATLVAVEVVNSTPAIELLHPATFSTLLQQYQFYLRQVARLYRGTVTQISGDRAVVSFDVRQCQDEHAFNALCCAQLFLILSQKLAVSQQSRNAQALEFKLTVHSGDVFFSQPWRKKSKGETEANVTETMVGKTFNLTQELLADAGAGEILVSELAYDLANGPQRFPDAPDKSIAKDGLELMGYSLPVNCGAHYELLLKQCAHLLPEQQAKS